MRISLEWIQEFIDHMMPIDALAHHLTMSGLEVEEIETVEGQTVFELGLTPNRADCLSIIGVAREIAAASQSKLKQNELTVPVGTGKIADYVSVSIDDASLCPRYSARVIQGICIAKSPEWLRKRLIACGIRPINNVVDITNYVMLEYGQPMHAFDLRTLSDQHIQIMHAGDCAEFSTLDHVQQTLVNSDLLIWNGNTPIALAGIMGGLFSEVSDQTTSIMLESAYFSPDTVRRTSRRLGLSTDSSRRFERGVDPNAVIFALHRACQLIVDIAGGECSEDYIDLYPSVISEKIISVPVSDINRILGTNLNAGEAMACVQSIDMPVSMSGESIVVTAPTYRPDIERPIDIIEEVARIYGYHHIKETMPAMHMHAVKNDVMQSHMRLAKQTLLAAGLSETVLYSFTHMDKLLLFHNAMDHAIEMTNPLSQDQSIMHTTLLPGLLDALSMNAKRQRATVKLFAIQPVFEKKDALNIHDEPMHIAGVISGCRNINSWDTSTTLVDFYDCKGIAELILEALHIQQPIQFIPCDNSICHLDSLNSALIECDGAIIGSIGLLKAKVSSKWDVDFNVYAFEIDIQKLLPYIGSDPVSYRELSKFPFIVRQLALLVPENISAKQVQDEIIAYSSDIISNISIVDVYSGKSVPTGQKSLGIRFHCSRANSTLTDIEVNQLQECLLQQLNQSLGATLRP